MPPMHDNNDLVTGELLRELEDCDFKELEPYTGTIKERMSSIKMDYDLYYVKLKRLANEMETIEEKNTKLENEILYQTSIYNRLRNLLIALEIKEEHFISLETDNFESSESLMRINKALEVLCKWEVKEYTIRVVREKRERIEKALRGFFHRFCQYFSTLLVPSKTNFKVHKNLYNRIKPYKEIYANARRYNDFYAYLCKSYTNHAKNLYEVELESYLREVKKVPLEQSLPSLFEGYTSIVGVELNFLKSINLDSDGLEIFASTNKLIANFIEEVFPQGELKVLNFLEEFLKESGGESFEEGEKEEREGGGNTVQPNTLQRDTFKVAYGRLKKRFITEEMDIRSKEEGLKRFKEVLKNCKIEDLTFILFKMNRERILKGNKNIFNIIESKRLLKELDLIYPNEEENELNDIFKRELIDFVYGEGEDKADERVKEVLGSLKGGEKEMEEEILSVLK